MQSGCYHFIVEYTLSCYHFIVEWNLSCYHFTVECNLCYFLFIIECSLGYYGYNCNQSCDGCLSDSCDKEYGVCTDTSGCEPGRQPGQPKCDLGIIITV